VRRGGRTQLARGYDAHHGRKGRFGRCVHRCALIQQRGLHEQLQRWTELARVLGTRAICGAAAAGT
jgi:hypothetical protein